MAPRRTAEFIMEEKRRLYEEEQKEANNQMLLTLRRTCAYFRYVIFTDPGLYLRYANAAKCRLFYENAAKRDAGPCRLAVQPSAKANAYGTVIGIQRFNIYRCPFTMCVRYRVDSFARGHQGGRVPLFSDWTHPWSFILFGTRKGPSLELRRNINSGGSDPEQGLIGLSPNSPDWFGNPEDPEDDGLGKWVSCVFTWSPEERTMRGWVNGRPMIRQGGEPSENDDETIMAAGAVVRPSVKDMTVQETSHPWFHIGWKQDGSEELEGEVSHLAVYRSLFSPADAKAACLRLMAAGEGGQRQRQEEASAVAAPATKPAGPEDAATNSEHRRSSSLQWTDLCPPCVGASVEDEGRPKLRCRGPRNDELDSEKAE